MSAALKGLLRKQFLGGRLWSRPSHHGVMQHPFCEGGLHVLGCDDGSVYRGVAFESPMALQPYWLVDDRHPYPPGPTRIWGHVFSGADTSKGRVREFVPFLVNDLHSIEFALSTYLSPWSRKVFECVLGVSIEILAERSVSPLALADGIWSNIGAEMTLAVDRQRLTHALFQYVEQGVI
jgi:hypothetical protein